MEIRCLLPNGISYTKTQLNAINNFINACCEVWAKIKNFIIKFMERIRSMTHAILDEVFPNKDVKQKKIYPPTNIKELKHQVILKKPNVIRVRSNC